MTDLALIVVPAFVLGCLVGWLARCWVRDLHDEWREAEEDEGYRYQEKRDE